MSQSPFPQLLKRANISKYDPLITRIYTSTPSSKSQHSDWGLKFAVPIGKKGPRYIKFNSLDAGPGVNCDWRSGEREARFIQAWGNGSVRWQNEDYEIPNYQVKSETNLFNSDNKLTEIIESDQEGEEGKMWMKDIESMSEKQFQLYLEKVRSSRKEFLDEKLGNLSSSIKDTLILPEDKTIIHLTSTGKLPLNSTINHQSSLTTSELKRPNSDVPSSLYKLHSKEHRVNGLSYSKPPTSTNDFTVKELDKKGRVLNKVARYDDAHSRAQSAQVRGNNLPWVIGLGGLTGKTQNQNNRINSDHNYNQSVDSTDYTRTDTSAGVGRFKVAKASISSSPTVLALKESTAGGLGNGGKVGGRWRQSTASQPSPLDTFKFDIDLSISSYESDPHSSMGIIEVGSPEWVGSTPKSSKLPNWQEEFKAGGPRSEREKGESLQKLRQSSAETMVRLNRLLGRHKVVKDSENQSS